MSDIIYLKDKADKTQELECLNCGATTFYIFPDSIVTCVKCKFHMELGVFGALYLSDPSNGN
jgi:hypothetical protein|tara:strand:- start:49 stop:234 length:186 start_codon:yes stop_codon:yes gene_type:complete